MNSAGAIAEREVANYLRKRGYKLLEFNFKSYHGEIDLIMKHGKTLAFVEVKARGANTPADPKDYVDIFKQQKLLKTAEYYLQYHPTKLTPRFDVAEVSLDGYRVTGIHYLKNAFEMITD